MRFEGILAAAMALGLGFGEIRAEAGDLPAPEALPEAPSAQHCVELALAYLDRIEAAGAAQDPRFFEDLARARGLALLPGVPNADPLAQAGAGAPRFVRPDAGAMGGTVGATGLRLGFQGPGSPCGEFEAYSAWFAAHCPHLPARFRITRKSVFDK